MLPAWSSLQNAEKTGRQARDDTAVRSVVSHEHIQGPQRHKRRSWDEGVGGARSGWIRGDRKWVLSMRNDWTKTEGGGKVLQARGEGYAQGNAKDAVRLE